MRTEDDIRAALTTLESEAPARHDVLAPLATGPARRTRPRLVVAVAIGTAAAIAVPLVVTAVVQRSDDLPVANGPWPGPGDPPSERWRWAFTVKTPLGWTMVGRSVGDLFVKAVDRQTAGFTSVRRASCSVTVYRPGAFDERRIPEERTPIEVNGRPGYIADVKASADPPGEVGAEIEATGKKLPEMRIIPPGPSIVWKYARDAWAQSTCLALGVNPPRDPVIADEKQLAEATVFETSPLLVPYRVGRLPTGWTGTSIGIEGPANDGPPQPDIWLTLQPADARPAALDRSIDILFTKNDTLKPRPGDTRLTIGGRNAWVNREGTEVTIQGDGFQLRVQGQKEHKAELIRIAQGLRFAPDPRDESTWFDGTDAIP